MDRASIVANKLRSYHVKAARVLLRQSPKQIIELMRHDFAEMADELRPFDVRDFRPAHEGLIQIDG